MKAQERRVEIPVRGPFTVQLQEDEERTWARLTMMDELPREPSKIVKRIFPLFFKHALQLTVKGVMETIEEDYPVADVRDALHELADEHCLEVRIVPGRAHKRVYHLHPDFNNQFALTSEYMDELRVA